MTEFLSGFISAFLNTFTLPVFSIFIATILLAAIIVALLPKMEKGFKSIGLRLLYLIPILTPALFWAPLQLILLALLHFTSFRVSSTWQGSIIVGLWFCLVIICNIAIFRFITTRFKYLFIPSERNKVFFMIIFSLSAISFLRYLMIGLESFVLPNFGQFMFFLPNN